VHERLDDDARSVMDEALAEARRMGHDQVGTEHLLLGLIARGRGGAAEALAACGATLAGCRAKVSEAVANKTPPLRAPTEPAFTDRAARALERATRLSLRERAPAVCAVHILQSVLDVEGTAGQVLRGVGVDPAAVRRRLIEGERPAEPPALTGPQTAAPTGPPAAAPPVCPGCRADLAAQLTHHELISRSEDGTTRRWSVACCSACGAPVPAHPLPDRRR
jgi:ATP-dependent Clp protease ATP-binding subunit ClpA